MSDLGSQLRLAREAKGLSFEQVFKATRIKAAYIEALESNRIDALPGIVQARGFVRSYANYLGLDGETLASALDTGNVVVAIPAPAATAPKPINGKDPQGRTIEPAKPIGPSAGDPLTAKPLGSTAAAAPLRPDRSPASSQATGKLRVPALSAAPVKSSSSATGGLPTPILIAGAVVLFLIGIILILTALSSGSKAPAPSTSSSTLDKTLVIDSATQPTQSIAMNSGPLSLTLAASEHVWVRITSDGQTAFEGMLAPNEVRSWDANDQIIVETGNAAALSVTRDGQTSVLGNRGQVVARAWSHASVEDVPVAVPNHSADLPAGPTSIATTTLQP